MVGRGTLIVIIGFSMIFGLAGQYWSREATSAVQNYVQYYGQADVYNVATAGANIGCDSLFNDQNATSLDLNGSFFDGTYSVTTAFVPGNSTELMLQSIGNYSDYTGSYSDTIQVLLTRRQYSQWEFFSDLENGVYWKTGDTVTGPLATNDSLYVSGTPYFYGQVSAKLGMSKSLAASPKFLAGLQTGVGYSMSSVMPTVSAASKQFVNTSSVPNSTYDVYLTFNSGGTVTYYTQTGHDSTYTTYNKWGRPTTQTVVVTSTTPSSTVSISSFAPNGIVAVTNGDAHVQGVLNGQVTVVTQQGAIGAANSGNIYIDNNITYQNNPITDPSSTDMLGLVAQNNVTLTASQSNVYIDAAIYAETGSFSYEYASSKNLGTSAYIDLLGSIANYSRGAVGTFNSGTNQMLDGYNKSYKYDKRLATNSPPSFPYTGTFGVVTWRETPPRLPRL